jgi:hypothetical protein
MDENSVSDEVRALLERMEQFPHEFYGKRAHWRDEFMDTFCSDIQTPLAFLLTAEEFILLKQAYRRLLRRTFSEEVIAKIINPAQGEFDF